MRPYAPLYSIWSGNFTAIYKPPSHPVAQISMDFLRTIDHFAILR